jgi:hypothetical protein
MSLLLSDSLVGVLDEKSLTDEDAPPVGKIKIEGKSYEIDAFISDRKVIRVHAIAEPDEAISLIKRTANLEANLILGEEDFVARGQILQVGWEKLSHGGRMVISLSIRDK